MEETLLAAESRLEDAKRRAEDPVIASEADALQQRFADLAKPIGCTHGGRSWRRGWTVTRPDGGPPTICWLSVTAHLRMGEELPKSKRTACLIAFEALPSGYLRLVGRLFYNLTGTPSFAAISFKASFWSSSMAPTFM